MNEQDTAAASRREFFSRRLDRQVERTFNALIKMRDLANRTSRLRDVPWTGGKDGWTLEAEDAAA